MKKKKIKFEDEQENELFTDLCTIKFGFGIVIINSMSYSNSWFGSAIALLFGVFYWSSEKLSFGYFKPEQYCNYVYKDSKDRNMKLEEFYGYIVPGARHYFPERLYFGSEKKSEIVKIQEKLRTGGFIIKIIVLIYLEYNM